MKVGKSSNRLTFKRLWNKWARKKPAWVTLKSLISQLYIPFTCFKSSLNTFHPNDNACTSPCKKGDIWRLGWGRGCNLFTDCQQRVSSASVWLLLAVSWDLIAETSHMGCTPLPASYICLSQVNRLNIPKCSLPQTNWPSPSLPFIWLFARLEKTSKTALFFKVG